MKILVLVTDAFGGLGGIAKFNRDLLNALCEMPQCDEVVVIPRIMPGKPETLPEKLTFVTSGINSKLKFVLATREMISHAGRFDLIICGHINLIPLAFLCQLRLKAPLGLIIHGIDAWKPTRSLVVNYVVKKIDFFIAVSDFTKQQFLSWTGLGTDIGHILPNCVEADKYGPGPKNTILLERYGLSGKKNLMTLGRLVSNERYKGFDEVLDVLPALALDMPEIAYLIVGGGNDYQRLQEKARVLGIAERVVFTGYIAEEEKADHFRLADLYVMPSRGEGFGIVFLEALACGIPTIGSRCDGSLEALMGGELGAVVDPSNKDELKAAIIAGLKQSTRVVPAGLEYFSFNRFKHRISAILKQYTHG